MPLLTQQSAAKNSSRPSSSATARGHANAHESGAYALQRTVGNQAMQRMLRTGGAQAKLTVNTPGDKYEQEADRVADQVMRMTSAAAGDPPHIQRATTSCSEKLESANIQRTCASCSAELGSGEIQRTCSGCDAELEPVDSASVPRNENSLTSLESGSAAVQRMCNECEEETDTALKNPALENDDEEKVMLKAGDAETTRPAPPAIESSALNILAGGGQPLPLSTRRFFEDRMARDFSAVRVHADARADELARSVNALAFTHANHLVFRLGAYRPDTSAGRHLLAHELAHTIQQRASPLTDRDSATTEASLQRSAMTPDNVDVPAGQPLCEKTPPPGDMTCPKGTRSTGSGTPITFGRESSTINPADLLKLSSIAAGWHEGGGVQMLRIDGFASCDGPAEVNWRLSCERAEMVRAELATQGVDPEYIEVFAYGETNEFSITEPLQTWPNRRAMVSVDGFPPECPDCGLAINGPIELDHYCADYVPSDAVECGDFPAPPITLTADGAAAGATLNWRISAGTDKASILGAITGPSVTIQGDAPSGDYDDVTAQVTDGTCTASHFLTVREPTEMTYEEKPARGPILNPERGPLFVANLITYTVLDQLEDPMGEHICVDETITICANSQSDTKFTTGDHDTDSSGQVYDNLYHERGGGVSPTLCQKSDQVITAGGCGPLMHNTILFQASGVTLTPNTSCKKNDKCP